jgi:hypothetical protein
MVPWTMVPMKELVNELDELSKTIKLDHRSPWKCHTIFQFNRHRLVGAFHQKPGCIEVSSFIPKISNTATKAKQQKKASSNRELT